MKLSQVTVPKSVALILILLIVLVGGYVVITYGLKKPSTEGCFFFTNGEIQGWTIDQLYAFEEGELRKITVDGPDDPETKIPYEPFELSNIPDMIQAYASEFQITDSTAEHCKFYFTSPDLSEDPNWQDIIGFRFNINREFKSHTIDWYSHKVFAEILAVDENGSEEILHETYFETDEMNYLEIDNFGVPYFFRCIPVELKNPTGKYTIKQLRIGCVIKGFNYNPNVQFKGGWKITNVCPLYN